MKKILLVEDEIVIALTSTMVLETEGYAVVSASDGQEGLAKADEEQPDLIITDYMMPRMNGLAMIRALREKGIATPIILTTSIPRQGLAADSPAPYDAYLMKPFRDTDLLKLVRRLLHD